MSLIPPTKNAPAPKPQEEGKKISFTEFIDLMLRRVGSLQEGLNGLQKDLYVAKDCATQQSNTILEFEKKLTSMEKQIETLKPKPKGK